MFTLFVRESCRNNKRSQSMFYKSYKCCRTFSYTPEIVPHLVAFKTELKRKIQYLCPYIASVEADARLRTLT